MATTPAYPCAYCGVLTPAERQAASPWTWPGKGMVTNCVSCAGDDALGAKVATRLRRDPKPFVQIVKRLPALSEREVRAGLTYLQDTEQAQIVYGRGWAKI